MMDELDWLLRKRPGEPEPRTDSVPEDARQVVCKPCAMGTESCTTDMTPLPTTCACGFRRFIPRVGYKLPQYP